MLSLTSLSGSIPNSLSQGNSGDPIDAWTDLLQCYDKRVGLAAAAQWIEMANRQNRVDSVSGVPLSVAFLLRTIRARYVTVETRLQYLHLFKDKLPELRSEDYYHCWLYMHHIRIGKELIEILGLPSINFRHPSLEGAPRHVLMTLAATREGWGDFFEYHSKYEVFQFFIENGACATPQEKDEILQQLERLDLERHSRLKSCGWASQEEKAVIDGELARPYGADAEVVVLCRDNLLTDGAERCARKKLRLEEEGVKGIY